MCTNNNLAGMKNAEVSDCLHGLQGLGANKIHQVRFGEQILGADGSEPLTGEKQ